MAKQGPKGPNGPRPHIWVSGPDEKTHDIYKKFVQQKNQANFRGETWLIGFEDYKDLWWDKWEQRGRTEGCYRSKRKDPQGEWSLLNFEIVKKQKGPQTYRRFVTPDGVFATVSEARTHYGLSKQEMVDLQRNHPEQWYVDRRYIKDKK